MGIRLTWRVMAFAAVSTALSGCLNTGRDASYVERVLPWPDTVAVEEVKAEPLKTADDIVLVKDLLYDQHTLADEYPYRDTTRKFQWDTIRARLALLENIQRNPQRWGVLRNRRNANGEPPLAKGAAQTSYGRMADAFGVERYQGIPLYGVGDRETPLRYALDGSLVGIDSADSAGYLSVRVIDMGTDVLWDVPDKYVKELADSVVFGKIMVVDRTNQNIAVLEKTDSAWSIRSMNPATTGLENPPYQHQTPLGTFVIQEKKPKMIYLVDGSDRTGGFAPYASRFCNGAYIHGVPVNAPATSMIEFSATLGTTPRSHMCVRNATSHARFVYDWAPVGEGLVVVIE